MKVTLPKDYKEYFTISDVERAKDVIKYAREDEEKVSAYADMAAREALKNTSDYVVKVIEVSAHAAKNCRAWNAYGETADMDIWLEATAKTTYGFIEIGAYLSDIYGTGAVDYRNHMWIQYYGKKSLG